MRFSTQSNPRSNNHSQAEAPSLWQNLSEIHRHSILFTSDPWQRACVGSSWGCLPPKPELPI